MLSDMLRLLALLCGTLNEFKPLSNNDPMKYYKKTNELSEHYFAVQEQRGIWAPNLRVVKIAGTFEIENTTFLPGSAEPCTEADFLAAYSEACAVFEKFLPKQF